MSARAKTGREESMALTRIGLLGGMSWESTAVYYRLLNEIFQENSVAAAIFAGSFVVGIFYTVTQIAIH